MRNKNGLTITERISKDIEKASMESNIEQRQLLAHMAISAAEFAIDFGLITYKEWDNLTQEAFGLI